MTENLSPEATAPAAEAPSQPREVTPEQRAFQTWHLLNCLAADPDRRLKWGDVKRKVITKKAREELNMTEKDAEQLLESLKQSGRVQASEKRGTFVYELTEAGEQHLSTLTPPESFADLAAAGPVTEEMLRYQHACLLLHLLAAENQTLTKSQANARLGQITQSDLQMKSPLANVRRAQLARQGYIEIDKQGRQEAYHLTADGRDYLTALEQHPGTEFRVTGATINALLSLARESPARETGSQAVANESLEPAQASV